MHNPEFRLHKSISVSLPPGSQDRTFYFILTLMIGWDMKNKWKWIAPSPTRIQLFAKPPPDEPRELPWAQVKNNGKVRRDGGDLTRLLACQQAWKLRHSSLRSHVKNRGDGAKWCGCSRRAACLEEFQRRPGDCGRRVWHGQASASDGVGDGQARHRGQ